MLVARGADSYALARLVRDFDTFGFDRLGRPHVPERLYACAADVQEHYLSGVVDACGALAENGSTVVRVPHAVTAQGVYVLLRLLDRTVSVECDARGYALHVQAGRGTSQDRHGTL